MLLCQVFCFWVKEKEEEIFGDGTDNVNSVWGKIYRYLSAALHRARRMAPQRMTITPMLNMALRLLMMASGL